jgi:hypothetical protein
MKKYVICLMAVAIGIAASAFTVQKETKAKTGGVYKWFDFNGNLLTMGDPYYYSLDPDNWPDCLTMLGLVYCEIKCLPDEYDDAIPDLSTICAIRYRPLL